MLTKHVHTYLFREQRGTRAILPMLREGSKWQIDADMRTDISRTVVKTVRSINALQMKFLGEILKAK